MAESCALRETSISIPRLRRLLARHSMGLFVPSKGRPRYYSKNKWPNVSWLKPAQASVITIDSLHVPLRPWLLHGSGARIRRVICEEDDRLGRGRKRR
jgi:hypothetical protein